MSNADTHDPGRISLDAMRLLIESTEVGIWHVDIGGYTRYINRAMCRILEVDGPEAMRGVHFMEFYSEEMRARLVPEFNKRMRGESSTEASVTSR